MTLSSKDGVLVARPIPAKTDWQCDIGEDGQAVYTCPACQSHNVIATASTLNRCQDCDYSSEVTA